MESDRFDAVTARLAAPLSRRSVGLLGLLGLGGTAGEAEAGKKSRKQRRRKKKKKPKLPKGPACTGCTACQACVNGACQPLADGASCGAGGVCLNDVCGKPCTFDGGQCTNGTVCPTESTVCISNYDCDAACNTNADCGSGKLCIATPCGVLGSLRCATIAAI